MSGRIAVPLLDGLAGAPGPPLAWVRSLTGVEEALLASNRDALPAELATVIIAAATERIGDRAPISPALARELSAGDRERLLLACAAATLGETVDLMASCPNSECGELIEIPIALRDLLHPLVEGVRPSQHEIRIGPRRLRFRLPNGGDQEDAARVALIDPEAAAALLVERCLAPDGEQAGAIDPVLATALDEAIEQLDTAAEIVVEAACPACNGRIRALLDGLTLLDSGIASGDRLFAEIDSLARAYHWSEADILSLPSARRRRYLDIIFAAAEA